MPYKCVIPGCGNNSKEVTMHCLPMDSKIRQKWCQILNRNDLIDVSDRYERSKFRVCDMHFSEESKLVVVRNRTNLKCNAVPTLNLGEYSSEEARESAYGCAYGTLDESKLVQPKLPGDVVFEMNSTKVDDLTGNPNKESVIKTIKPPLVPSSATTVKLLRRISTRPGLHNEAFKVLKAKAENIKNPLDKYCILMFHEIRLRPNLQPNYKDGSIEGFEDLGFKKSNNVADRAQIFMLCGINHQWKQPIYYTFICGETKNTDLVRVIKFIIRKCSKIGLNIIATVCDHTRINRAAINRLVKNTLRNCQKDNIRKFEYYFEVDGHVIIPLFDVPHLFRGLRNLLLKHDLQFVDKNEVKLAKWTDIYTVYKMDLMATNLRPGLSRKLTDSHVMADKINKINVSKCLQVFSHSVASAINDFIAAGPILITEKAVMKMDKSASDTATLLEFLDQLFDSLNGSFVKLQDQKPLKSPVTKESSHMEVWNQALIKLDSFEFVDNTSLFIPVTVKYLKKTIKNFCDLWNIMQNLGFESLSSRTFHQDSVDQFLAKIRQIAHHDINLTSSNFKHYYKSIVINDWNSQFNVLNCEADKFNVLRTLQHLVSEGLSEKQYVCKETYCTIDDSFHVPVKAIQTKIFTHVIGMAIKKVGNQTCDCKSNVFDKEHLESFTRNQCLNDKYYSRNDVRLKYVNPIFLNKLKYTIGVIRYLLNRNICKSGIFDHILETLRRTVSFTNCFHDNTLKKDIFKYLIKVSTNNYCKGVNEILIGLHRRDISKNTSLILKNAKKKFNHNRKRRKALRKLIRSPIR